MCAPKRTNGKWRNGRPSEGWEAVAASLAREVEGLPLLTGEQVEAVALRLPTAIRKALGPDGLEAMRTGLMEAVCWWAGDLWEPDDPSDVKRWWRSCSRWEPTAPLCDEPPPEMWELLAGHLSGMCDLPMMTPEKAEGIYNEAHQALNDFRMGARWDQDRYESFLVRELYQEEMEGSWSIDREAVRRDLEGILERDLLDSETLNKIRSVYRPWPICNSRKICHEIYSKREHLGALGAELALLIVEYI